MINTACPSCGQHNFRKVTAIIDQETVTTSIPVERTLDWWKDNPRQRYETTRDVVSRSALAEKLMPPQNITTQINVVRAPETVETEQLQKAQTPWIGVGLWASFIITMMIALLMFATLSDPKTANSPSATRDLYCVYPVLFLMSFGMLAFFERKRKKTKVDRSNIPSAVKQKVDEHRKRYEDYQSALQQQSRAIARYQNLFYCDVCGKVFDPEDKLSRAVPLGLMNDYIWAD